MSAILVAKADQDYSQKKFLAAIQGVDLDAETGQSGVDEFERIKTEAFSHGATSDPNDILSLQGVNAESAGFGIGMGLEFAQDPSNPLG